MHVAFILDGNRRWAKAKGLPKSVGHHRGYQNFKKLLPACIDAGIDTVTAYVLSTENIAERDTKELAHLFKEIQRVGNDIGHFEKHGIRVQIFGKSTGLPVDVRKTLKSVERATAKFNKLTCNLCINYGGRDEIVRAAKQLAKSGKPWSEKNLSAQLDSAGQSDPDFIVRTGGKARISNFLIWQAAYAEIYVTDKLWPEFNANELKKALDWFTDQKRTFGK